MKKQKLYTKEEVLGIIGEDEITERITSKKSLANRRRKAKNALRAIQRAKLFSLVDKKGKGK